MVTTEEQTLHFRSGGLRGTGEVSFPPSKQEKEANGSLLSPQDPAGRAAGISQFTDGENEGLSVTPWKQRQEQIPGVLATGPDFLQRNTAPWSNAPASRPLPEPVTHQSPSRVLMGPVAELTLLLYVGAGGSPFPGHRDAVSLERD